MVLDIALNDIPSLFQALATRKIWHPRRTSVEREAKNNLAYIV
jgi:hypothetical protein